MPLRTGFIGLGNIGKPMARRILEAGLPLTVYDLLPGPVAELAGLGALAAASPRELASASDIVGICVRDDAEVRDVVVGNDGLLAGAHPGLVLAVHSTVLPRTVREIASAASSYGVRVVDACVTGGAAGAERGALTYMVGGDEADVARCKPAFTTSAAQIVHTGPLGTGTATKLCNNLMTYLGFLAVFEATSLARAAGLSDSALERVTRANGNLTEQMLAFLGLHRLPESARKDVGFQRLLRGFAQLAEKDLDVTLEFAREQGVALPGTARCRDLISRAYGVEEA